MQHRRHCIASADLPAQPPSASSTPAGLAVSASVVKHLWTRPVVSAQAENRVVGAPCGVMDQMAAALGRRRRLLALSCRPAHLLPPVTIPDNLRFWGVDSGGYTIRRYNIIMCRTPAQPCMPSETCVHVVVDGKSGHIAQGSKGS